MTKIETPSQFFDQEASIPKLLFLAALAIGLCSFGPMSIVAPVPLAIAFLLYGRLITFSISAISLVLLGLAAMQFKGFPFFIGGMFLTAFLFAFFVAEIIFRNINPTKGLLFGGLIFVLLFGASLIAVNKINKLPLKEEITQSVSTVMMELKKQKVDSANISGEEQRIFDDLVNKPEVIANEIYNSLPLILFGISYFGFWVSLYVTLRNSIVWRSKVSYDFSLRDLTQFKTPYFFVYPLILSLVLFLGGDYGLPKESEIIGKNLLFSLGIFYLFQGFGVYIDFLKFLKIRGFIKTFFIAFTLLLASKFLALVGIFDLWFDFRKFFTNTKKDEGDTI